MASVHVIQRAELYKKERALKTLHFAISTSHFVILIEGRDIKYSSSHFSSQIQELQFFKGITMRPLKNTRFVISTEGRNLIIVDKS
jgi:hypothetical protein